MKNTRIAYGYHPKTGNKHYLGDTVGQALESNMTVKHYEQQLIKSNPQLQITIKLEPMGEGE